MGLCQIPNVDIVPDAGTVSGGIVVTEDADMAALEQQIADAEATVAETEAARTRLLAAGA